MSQMRLREAMAELELANKEQERCHLEWLIARTANPSAIDPFAAEAYCVASHLAALAQTRYHDLLCEAQAEYLRNDTEAAS